MNSEPLWLTSIMCKVIAYLFKVIQISAARESSESTPFPIPLLLNLTQTNETLLARELHHRALVLQCWAWVRTHLTGLQLFGDQNKTKRRKREEKGEFHWSLAPLCSLAAPPSPPEKWLPLSHHSHRSSFLHLFFFLKLPHGMAVGGRRCRWARRWARSHSW